jgi:hypothetical protein
MALGFKVENFLDSEENRKEIEQDFQAGDYVKDILAAPFRGLEGAAQSVYNLADFAAFDYLPDYNNRFLGKSETVAGSLVEGVTQFVIPFGAISKGAKAASSLGRFGKTFSTVDKAGKARLNWKGVLAAETATDFVAFDAQEERLSNLINSFPSLRNPVTEFLEAKEDDGEIEGRFKNSLEGLGLTGLASGFMVGLKSLRKQRRGEDGATYLATNSPAFAKRAMSEMDTYNAYSPSLRAIDAIKEEELFIHQITDRLNKAAGGIRGISEEIKWMGLDDPEYVKEIVDPKYIKGDKVTKLGLAQAIERSQLPLKIVEREPNTLYRTVATQQGGDRYREFTLDIDVSDLPEKLSKRFERQRKEMIDRESYTTHYDPSAMNEGRSNLAHFRTTDRYDEDGVMTLYVEELQSDYLQSLSKTRRKAGENKLLEERAPLEKSYVDSMMRMILQMAASEGYGRVTWAKGKDVAELYDSVIDELKVNKINPDGSKSLLITRNGETMDKIVKDKAELEELLGKKAADDVNTWEEGRSAERYEAKVSPTPFVQQYDQRMPSAVERFSKKFKTRKSFKEVERLGTKETITIDKTKELLGVTDKDVGVEGWVSGFKEFGSRLKLVKKGTGKEESYEKVMLDALEVEVEKIRQNYGEEFEFDLEDIEQLASDLDSFSFQTEENVINSALETVLKRYDIQTGSSNTVSISAHSIDINDEMKDSLGKGVSMWGLKTKNKQNVGSIKDPELKAALGLEEAENIDLSSALREETLATRTEMVKPATMKTAQVGFALDRLSKNASTAEGKKLATALKTLIGEDAEVNDATIQAYLSRDALGSYDPIDNQVHLYTNKFNVMMGGLDPEQVFTEATLLHEIAHATSVTKIPPEISAARTGLTGTAYLKKVDKVLNSRKTSQPVKQILTAYKKALDSVPASHKNILNYLNDPVAYQKKFGSTGNIDEWYGLTNVDEFIAEALSNPNFQSFLKGIEGEGKSLWQNILDSLKELIGLDAKGTVLEDVVSAYSDLVSKTKKRYSRKDYKIDVANKMFGTRSSRAFQQRADNSHAQVISNAADEIQLDTDGLKRGGRIAITGVRNSIKEVETTGDLGELLAIAETKIEQELKANPKLNADRLEKGGIMQAVERFSALTGSDKDFITSEVNAATKDANELRRIAARMYVVESLATDQADNIWSMANEITKKGTAITDQDKAQFVGELKKMLHLVAAGSNLRRGFGQGLQSTQFKRNKLALSDVELRSKEIVAEYMDNNTSVKFEVLINRILAAGDPDDVINNTLGIVKQAKAADPNGFMEKAQNWYINSLLSGPRTFMKNGVGNFIAQTLLQVETAIGGVFVNPAITKQVLKEMATLESFREGMQFFLKAYKQGDQFLDVGRSPLESGAKTERPMLFNAAPEQSIRESFNWFGENVVNIPTRLLMSMDEVFKQSMFRQNAKLELTLKGMKLGIKDPDALAEYVTNGLDKVLVDGERAFNNSGVIKYAQDAVAKEEQALIKAGGERFKPSERGRRVQALIDQETAKRGEALKSVEEGGLGFESLEEIDNVAARSLEQARYGTFTNDAGKAAELAQAMTSAVPLLKFVFPFVRTPINILKFSFDRAAFAAPEMSRNILARMPDMPMLKQTQQDIRRKLDSRDPLEKSRAIGKMTTSAMINSTLLYMVYANRDLLTGGGPADRNELKTLEQTGWQKYSFRVGDKYFSFSGLDPIGTHFGVLVDLVEQLDNGNELDTTLAEQVFSAATISMTRNLTEKSYLAGLTLLSDALSDPENRMEKLVQNFAAGFVPNVLYQGQSVVGDTTVRETRNLADAILKKLPTGGNRLDPKRNLLGEPIIAEQVPFVGPFNPSRMSTRKGDIVFEELAQLEHGFTNPRPELDRMINLDEFVNDQGRTAHDRRLELSGTVQLGGLTLRQRLERTIKAKNYQRLSTFNEGGFKSPRVDVLNNIIRRYRSAALNEMFKEFPEIKEKHQILRVAKAKAKGGAGEDVLSQLVNLTQQ